MVSYHWDGPHCTYPFINCVWTLFIVPLLAVTKNASMKSVDTFLSARTLLFLLVMCPGAELLGHSLPRLSARPCSVNSCTRLHSRQRRKRIPVPPHPHRHFLLSTIAILVRAKWQISRFFWEGRSGGRKEKRSFNMNGFVYYIFV